MRTERAGKPRHRLRNPRARVGERERTSQKIIPESYRGKAAMLDKTRCGAGRYTREEFRSRIVHAPTYYPPLATVPARWSRSFRGIIRRRPIHRSAA